MKIAFNPKSAAPLNKAPSGDYLNAITFDLAGHNIFARGELFKGTDTTYLVFRKATQDAVGYNGLVPAPSYTETSIRLLREDGTWIVPKQRPIKLGGSDYIKGTDIDKALDIHSGNGISIESDDTGKIIINSTLTVDGDFSGTIADAFTQVNIGGNILKAVTNKTLTFVGNGVTLTPNTTTNTILMSVPVMIGATSSENGTAGLVPAPANNQYMCFLRGDGNWVRVEGASAKLVTSTTDGIVPKFDNASGNIDNQASDWVLTSKNGTLGWFKLPMSAFASDWDSITGKPDTFTPSAHKHPTSHIDALTDYSKANSAEALVTTDTLNSALGKLEYKADTVYVWYKSVTGTDNDEIINKWEEIVDFIDSVKEGTDITDEFVTRKTTQTITGAKTFSAATSITNTLTAYDINPATTNTYSLGTSDLRWKNIYATNGNFSSTISASGFLKANSSDDKVLLGGGGHKAISDFMLKSDELTNNLTTITKSITLTKDWQDTGIVINNTTFPDGSGTYAVQVFINAEESIGFWYSLFSGVASFQTLYTNGTEPDDEILLHHSSHGCSKQIYLKTKPTSGGQGYYNKLYIACNSTCSTAVNVVFKFKKLI